VNKINILHLRSSNFYGGPERQLHHHCLKASNSEFNITCGSFSENNETPDFLNVIAQDNINTITFNVTSAYDLNAIRIIREYISKNKINIICTHDYRAHFYGNMAREKKDTSWVAFSRGWTKDNFKIHMYCWFDKFIIRFADHIIAVSHAQKKSLINVLVSPNKITVAHNAITPGVFEKVQRINLKEKFNLPKESIVGIAGGRFSSEKGQRYLVDAAKITVQKNNKLRFILFGDGPDFQKIQFKIKALNLQNYIFCPGFEKNIIGCIKDADFLINASLSEGLPNIVLESMAMKTLCVATDVGGVGEIIENEFSGLLVPAQSPEKLAEAILKIKENDSLTSKLTDNAFKSIIDKFSFDIQYENIKRVYSGVLKNK
jgi:glycosyltransferase involved in cell wall biosynthesis